MPNQVSQESALRSLMECDDESCASGPQGEQGFDDGAGFKARIGSGRAEILFAPKQLTNGWCSCTSFVESNGDVTLPAAVVDKIDSQQYAYTLDFSQEDESESIYLVVENKVLSVYLLEGEEPVAHASAPLDMIPFQGPVLKALVSSLANTEELEVVLDSMGVKQASGSQEVLIRDMAYVSYACLIASMLIDSTELSSHLFASFDTLFDPQHLEMAALSPVALDYLSLLKVRIMAPGKSMTRILSSLASNGYGAFTSQYVQSSEASKSEQYELMLADKKIDSLLMAVSHNAEGISKLSSLQVADVNQLATDVANLKKDALTQVPEDITNRMTELSQQLKDTTRLSAHTREYLQQLGIILNRALK